MSFLGTTTGQQLISSGAFNATGAALVAGLAGNVANVTAGATALAAQIDRAVRPLCLRHAKLTSQARRTRLMSAWCRPCPGGMLVAPSNVSER
jgi:hypothetical protein